MIVHTASIFNDWWLIMCRSKNCWNNGKWFKHPLLRQFLKGPWAAPIWSSMMIWMRNLLYIKKQHIQIKRDPRKRNGLVSKWKRSHDATSSVKFSLCRLWAREYISRISATQVFPRYKCFPIPWYIYHKSKFIKADWHMYVRPTSICIDIVTIQTKQFIVTRLFILIFAIRTLKRSTSLH